MVFTDALSESGTINISDYGSGSANLLLQGSSLLEYRLVFTVYDTGDVVGSLYREEFVIADMRGRFEADPDGDATGTGEGTIYNSGHGWTMVWTATKDIDE